MRRHENWLKAFIKYGSSGEAPLSTLFWTGVATIAGATRRKTYIDRGHFQWLTNVYVVLVAPPGIIAKSTTANIGMNLLREVPGVKMGPDIITPESLIQIMGEMREDYIDPETAEYKPQCAFTLSSDELGNLIDMKNTTMLNIMISLWDGKEGVFEKFTKTSGKDKLINPWLNMIACTTPAWIADSFTETMMSGGFCSRVIFVYADKKRQLVAYPVARVDADMELLRKSLIEDLTDISTVVGAMHLTKEAEAWGQSWYEKHWSSANDNDKINQFQGYISRKQTHLHKLAMILSLAKRSSRIITLEDLQEADTYLTAMEHDMTKVFAILGQTASTKLAAQLVEIVNRQKEITKTKLFSAVFRQANYTEFEEAANSCIQSGKLKLIQNGDRLIYIPA